MKGLREPDPSSDWYAGRSREDVTRVLNAPTVGDIGHEGPSRGPPRQVRAAPTFALVEDPHEVVALDVGPHRGKGRAVRPVPPGVLEGEFQVHLRPGELVNIERNAPKGQPLGHGCLLLCFAQPHRHVHKHRPTAELGPRGSGSVPPSSGDGGRHRVHRSARLLARRRRAGWWSRVAAEAGRARTMPDRAWVLRPSDCASNPTAEQIIRTRTSRYGLRTDRLWRRTAPGDLYRWALELRGHRGGRRASRPRWGERL